MKKNPESYRGRLTGIQADRQVRQTVEEADRQGLQHDRSTPRSPEGLV